MQLMFYHLESYGISDIGLIRQNNEDVWIEIPKLRFFALADGMGGHKAGEVAAKEVISHLSQTIKKSLSSSETFTPDQLCHLLKEAILQANRFVYQLAQQKEELSGMGTTLCCFFLHDQRLIYAHVGDSRIYRFRTQLKQLTVDHSLKRELIDKGELDEKAASSFQYKNIITRAIGSHLHVEPEVSTTLIQEGDIYFLCSDGLTDYVSDEEISSIIQKSKSVKEACTHLVDAANAHGGNDNITIVMIKVIK